jgi:hypothetical protein
VKKVLGVFDSSGGGSSAGSSFNGNGNAGSFRAGFGRFFGGNAQSSQNTGNASLLDWMDKEMHLSYQCESLSKNLL